jgi:fermentation-respiration switch protein FrsA (DUF1100 family)
MAEIKDPILFVTGDRDELVPYEMTRELFDASKQSKKKELVSID